MVYFRKDKIKQCIDFYFEVYEGLFCLLMDVKIRKKIQIFINYYLEKVI